MLLGAALVLSGLPRSASAACTTPFADANQDGVTNVVDTQCAIITVLWDLSGEVGSPPACTQGNPAIVDVNCDGSLTVSDAQLHIVAALGQTLSPAIDADANGCPDACDALACGDGFCDPIYESESSCPVDCDVDDKGSCCLPNQSPGCADADIESTVCAEDTFCCEEEWDDVCVALAAELANACIGDCCAANGSPGCSSTSDFACESCVCAIDSLCCDVLWSETCGSVANDACLAECGCQCGDGICQPFEDVGSCPQDCVGQGSCCLPTAAGADPSPGCNATATQSAVCAADSFCCQVDWDELCVQGAKQLGVSCTGECCAGNPTPGCDSAGDAACEACVCGADSFCCDALWDADCGSCANGGPGFGGICDGVSCAVACGCAEDPCGDGVCDPALGENPLTCPADCAGEGPCCEANTTPGCEDAAAQATVCAIDPLCCTDEWDASCALLAAQETALCGGEDCCAAKELPGCASNAPCEACVCGSDSFCCANSWDGICAGAANAACAAACLCEGPVAVCGNGFCEPGESVASCPQDCPGAGSCCEPNGTPGCESPSAQAVVCGIDPFCCADEWDDLCAQLAEAETSACDDGICCAAKDAPGCANNAACEACVCGEDSFCCDTAWDGICAGAANGACVSECGCAAAPFCGDGTCGPDETVASCPQDCPGEGSCCEANGTPGCQSAAAQATVCAIDPRCCEDEWDALCVQIAEDETNACTVEACCEAKATAGCGGNEACEGCVCVADPFCCNSSWDTLCAGAASGDCALACGCVPPDACGNGVCEPALGEDVDTCPADCTCGDGVCDGGETIFTCPADCAAPGCGDGVCDAAIEDVTTCPLDCAGSNGCCLPSDDGSPGCEDLALQLEVCAVDSFCCESTWDSACALGTEAFGACDGDCCDEAGNDSAGCGSTGDLDCEQCVCAEDPFCCEAQWDEQCAALANDDCGTDCGCGEPPPPPTGACCVALGGSDSFCPDSACTGCVCPADPFCCNTGWDGLCADRANGECEAACGCGVAPPPPPTECCDPEGLGGEGSFCGDASCNDCVCAEDPFCCETGWDAFCGALANGDCEAECGCDTPPPPTGECCEALGGTGAFCPDASCTDCVCAFDAFCCETGWDFICAEGASDACPAECGCGAPPPPPADCCDLEGLGGSGAFCPDAACTGCVCAADPFCCNTGWDAACALGANDECAAACGCESVNLDCCAEGGLGGVGAFCPDTDCTECACAADAFCCNTGWDFVCASLANEGCAEACGCVPPTVGDGSCCVQLSDTASGLCEDEGCTGCVCPADPFCCDTSWDGLCAGAANDTCELECGCGGALPPVCGNGICEPGETPANCPADCALGPAGCCAGLGGLGQFCPDAACSDCACAIDPFCCETGWDFICGDVASEACAIECGCDAADCCDETGLGGEGIFCADAACNDCVCAEDPLCCETGWDALCGALANGSCETECGCGALPPPTGACCEPLGGEGELCPDPSCTDCVCALDAFCCETGWDFICASGATDDCPAECGCGAPPPPPADCCDANGLGDSGAFCPDAACTDCVCAADAFCCESGWDATCALGANGECAAACGCESVDLDCCAEGGLGGVGAFCPDTACTDCACAADAFCCNTGWDFVCAALANEGCVEACGCAPPVVGDGSCCVALGGGEAELCEDESCTGCVCPADPFCCDTSWDALCAGAATGACQSECGCGAAPSPVCGDGICEPGETPTTCPADCAPEPADCCAGLGGVGQFCPDPACSDCACALDPFCCETGWDFICADVASEECATECGCG